MKSSIKKGKSNTSGKNQLSSSSKKRRVLSVDQLLSRSKNQRKNFKKRKTRKPIKPIIPPKSLIIILKDNKTQTRP